MFLLYLKLFRVGRKIFEALNTSSALFCPSPLDALGQDAFQVHFYIKIICTSVWIAFGTG